MQNQKNQKLKLVLMFLLLVVSGAVLFVIFRNMSKQNLDLKDEADGCKLDLPPTLRKLDAIAIAKHAPKSTAAKFNIIHITFDDMRNSMPPYVAQDHPMFANAINPKLTTFLQTSTAFHARTRFMVCSPSRIATTTGKAPQITNSKTFETLPQQTCPGLVTIPEYFTRKGYTTQTIGKYFHAESELNYDQMEYDTGQTTLPHISTQVGNSECQAKYGYVMYCSTKNTPADNSIVSNSIGFIRDRANERALLKPGEPEKNWGLFAGFHHSHWQNDVPTSYLSGLIDYIDQPFVPNIPNAANWFVSLAYRADFDSAKMKVRFGNSWQRIVYKARTSPDQIFSNPIYRATVVEMLKYYLGSIRFGLNEALTIVESLDLYNFRNNTLVVIGADHGLTFGGWGYALGKNNHGPYSTNVPLFIRYPGQKVGLVNQGLASNMDIFPTLVDATFPEDLPGLNLDGNSLLKGISDPNYNANPNGVISEYPRCDALGTTQINDCQTHTGTNTCSRKPITYMGYTLETLEYRLTDWWHHFDNITGCGPLAWPNMPQTIAQLSQNWPHWAQIDPKTTTTLWNQAPLKQTELYAMQNHVIASDNLATKPANGNIVNSMTSAIVGMNKAYKNTCQYF